MKALRDLDKFINTLPYASEIFGVYQPLLGWKSKRILKRIEKGFLNDKLTLVTGIFEKYKGEFKLELDANSGFKKIDRIHVGAAKESSYTNEVTLIKEIERILPAEKKMNSTKWKEVINEDSINRILDSAVKQNLTDWMKRAPQSGEAISEEKVNILKEKVNRESKIAGLLLDIVKNENYEYLKQIFFKPKTNMPDVLKLLEYKDPFELVDPKKELEHVGLSPIGIVHLFRQYFFEFDTFLGTSVGHIWLSPDSTVELVEVSTRKTITDKYVESQSNSILKSDKSITDQDEFSEAVKEDNRSEIKFGANVSAKQSWIWGSANQSASFDLKNTHQTAREQSHKHMRLQSEKLSSEIRQNYKSIFKTVTETTDSNTKRYVISNKTTDLLNYELRRKMRQVGVQVQDIGTYLCWQGYVDEPGQELGIANLVHIAKSPDTDSIPHPEQIVPKAPFTEKINIQIPFVGKDTDDKDISYTNGSETEVGFLDSTEHIEYKFPQIVICKETDYYLQSVTLQPNGAEVKPSVRDLTVNENTNEGKFTVYLDYVHFHGQNNINLEATLYWKPNQDENKIKEANEKNLSLYTEKIKNEYKKEFVNSARERIKLASNIQSRNYEDLREEERIVVYRKIIQELLAPENLIRMADFRTRHVVSELLNSIFDVDKMLYFVAPEWWKPRMHYDQTFGSVKPTGKIGLDGFPEMRPNLTNVITSDNLVSWGGINEMRKDNYYITEESKPAKLGSSLGWLLQLDGDNLRNAFLNAPWVKAVIPIRPGKEKAAINWLKEIEGVDGISKDDIYTGNEPDLQGKSMVEVLEILAEKVQKKHEESIKISEIPDPLDPMNEENTVSATPVDKVYEHGFYPLQGGFKIKIKEDFEIFDQWIEVLPTDQIVAVEVKYDPKTGNQI
jgi:hypothetical protein